MGDFNEILSPHKVKRGVFSYYRAVKFANVMSECNLMDIGTYRSLFT